MIRYIRIDGTTRELLHCAAEGKLSEKEFPKCRGCVGDTEVEFQIMPGLLAQMDSDVGGKEELDWGVLNVLTCKSNCKSKMGYVEEYLWRQEVSQEGLKSEADM
jgi:Programmed cell death protein 2, C-terminal putative domain